MNFKTNVTRASNFPGICVNTPDLIKLIFVATNMKLAWTCPSPYIMSQYHHRVFAPNDCVLYIYTLHGEHSLPTDPIRLIHCLQWGKSKQSETVQVSDVSFMLSNYMQNNFSIKPVSQLWYYKTCVKACILQMDVY